MALGYLISPALQVDDVNGKPLTGGYIRVYRHGTTEPIATYKDFNGDRNPINVTLNAKGMAVILAPDTGCYDVYCYDKYNVEQWSRLSVTVTAVGLGSIYDFSSEDGTVSITESADPAGSTTVDFSIQSSIDTINSAISAEASAREVEDSALSSAITAEADARYLADSALSSSLATKMDSTASSLFYSTSNPSGFITGIDLSPYATTAQLAEKLDSSSSSSFQLTASMSAYVPYSAVSADTANNVTSINGSAVGVFTGVSANSNITGSGTSASPLGLSNKVTLVTASSTAEYDGEGFSATVDSSQSAYYNGSSWALTTKGDSTHWHYLGVSGGTSLYLNYNSNYYINRLTPSAMTLTDEWYPARYTAQYALGGVTLSNNSSESATLNTAALTFADSAGTAYVDRTSIDKWNSIPTGATATHETVSQFGEDNDVVSANVYETGYNVVARTVSASGLPELTMYGFGSLPSTSLGQCTVNGNGVFVALPERNFYLHVEHSATGSLGSSWLPTAEPTGMAEAKFVNVSDHDINIMTDTYHGRTADIPAGTFTSVYHNPEVSGWIDLLEI